VDKIDMDAIIAKATDMEIAGVDLLQDVARVEPKKELKDYSNAELLAMPSEEFRKLMRDQPGSNIPKELLIIAMQRGGQKEGSL